jgi:hypothetical protein
MTLYYRTVEVADSATKAEEIGIAVLHVKWVPAWQGQQEHGHVHKM